jgi:hypothetical protein
MRAEPTPWPIWLAAAQRLFALSPREFWALSVREWRALTRTDEQILPRAQLNALRALYPD